MKIVNPSLLILAAGMGSRYGGLKQMDAFGPNGETIMDYSIYDAWKAGFKDIVFVVRDSFAVEFELHMNQRWGKHINLHYVLQELEDLPIPPEKTLNREKPWGTAHAVWVARNCIAGPFGVINADDFYGREAMISLYQTLTGYREITLIGYPIKDTLSDHGTVNRGVCLIDAEGYLLKIKECKNIHSGEVIHFKEHEKETVIDPNTLVSMNMWAFGPETFTCFENHLKDFIAHLQEGSSQECYIPDVIQELIENQQYKILVKPTRSKWYGVTYREDKPQVAQAFAKMVEEGIYPKELTC